jgi:voltage-gated sodium channel
MQATSTSVSPGWRQRLAALLNTPLFGHTITALILLNAIILGVETSAVA